MSLATGCVGLDEHKRVEFALRKCQAKNEELARDLEDARGLASGARMRISGVEGELGTQKTLVFVSLVMAMATISGMIYGGLF